LLDTLLAAGPSVSRLGHLCMVGLSEGALQEFADSALVQGLELVRGDSVLALAGRQAAACFRVGRTVPPDGSEAAAAVRAMPPTAVPGLLFDKANALGLHMQGAVSVANLDERGYLKVPPDAEVWIEVGSNNWEMLRDEAWNRPDVFLLTFEPLVDKWAYIQSLARRPESHVVLPFAVAPGGMGSFAPIRSQNYSDFRGERGRSFQESGASSLLHYSEDFVDHHWQGAATQYMFFREYLVPTVSLEWVANNLLGAREIDFLKIDAQGMDFFVFASLGRHARRVRRVQMELHTNVRHQGEIPCAEVVERMARTHKFGVERGRCRPLDLALHDEVDVVFFRL